MSNHPPPPPYGAPVNNTNGYMAPYMGGYNHAMTQHPYQQREQAPFMYGQSQQSAPPPPPHANANSFHANAHGVTTPGPGNGVIPATVFGAYGSYTHHMHHTAIPPPPYPSAPIPFGSNPYLPSHPTQSYAISNPSPQQNLIPSAPANQQAPTNVQNVNSESSNDFTPAVSDLEDGEVNDGESDKIAQPPEASTMDLTFSRQTQVVRNEIENLTTVPATASNTNGLEESGTGPFQEPHFVPNEQFPISSPQPQRPSNQHGVVDHLHSISSNSMSEKHRKMRSPRGIAVSPARSTNALLDETLEKAKKALLELHSHGFDFAEIVDTIGVNSEVLGNIYTEVGIPVIASSRTQLQNTSPHVTSGDDTKSRPPMTEDVDQVPPAPQETTTTAGKPNSRPSATTAKDGQSSVRSPAAAIKPTKTSNTSFQGKGSGIKVNESKVVDRKEYIARMLAAKAAVSTKTSAATEPEPHVQANPTQTPPITLPVTSQPGVQPITSRTMDTEMEAKRKAQTELARQKMEALKRTKSIQHESRTIENGEPGHQDPQDREPVTDHRQGDLFNTLSTVPQPPIPGRQGSYFSPASQRQPFAIPGLFTTSDASEKTAAAQQFAGQSFTPSQRIDDKIVSGSGYQHLPTQSVDLPSKDIATTQGSSILVASADGGIPTLPAVSTVPVSTNRKRQKASDFIDSPSTRVKRPLGHQEDTSVIIDISEDESNNHSDDDSLDMNKDDRPHDTPKKSHTSDFGFNKQKSIRDLPPLTDLPPRRKPPVMTPPAAQTPGQTKDAKGLKMEIELMNRKIAELEQRRLAKLNTSRTQTPVTSGHAPFSSPPNEPSQGSIDASKCLAIAVESKSDASEFNSTRQSSSAAAETKEPVTEEQVIAEQRLQEAEQSLPADVTLEEDRRLQEETLQASIREQASIQQIEPRDLQGEQRTQLQGLDQQQSHTNVAQESHAFEGKQQADRLLRQQQEQEQSHMKEDLRLQEDRQKLLERRTQIEAGLPVLDATVERTRRRVELLRGELVDLEKQIRDGVEGRRSLVEELASLSQATEGLELSKDRRSLSNEIEKEAMLKDETQVASQSEVSARIGYEHSTPPIIEGTAQNVAALQTNPQPSHPAQTEDVQLSDGELEEDVMDISRSDADAGETSNPGPGHIAEDQIEPGLVDNEVTYEPPSDIGMSQNLKPNNDSIPLQHDDQTFDVNMPDVAQETSVSESSAEDTSEMQTSTEQTLFNANIQDADMQNGDKSAHSSPSLADDSDPNDYEPPEPFEEDQGLQSASANHSEASFSPLNTDNIETVVPLQSGLASILDNTNAGPTTVGADSQEGRSQKSNYAMGRFTPYESPLKHFKSYRYHPAYLKEVSSGFRSLTYSHTIDPDIPICRYELGGVCNDDSCKNQHLRGIGLNDDKILMSLGARPEGLSEQDEEKFTDGLKKIIQDIRSRKVTDFNVVAAEITAYRAKFLGDSSKILPL
ncbi:hypothetical protein N7G274_003518 [Stereocaulon virgatum]|uniref:Putative zinc-finger domain-containing protein n=1 Tax=Stereocaulon virgatum TaxID=373712 RepID=A0ABR4AHB9_9LECA